MTAAPGARPGGPGSLARAAASGTKWLAFSQASRVILATVGAALYVAVSLFLQRPLLKDITGVFFSR